MNEPPESDLASHGNYNTPSPGPQTILGEVTVYSNQEVLAKYSIEHGEYIIGRDATCHILVDADEVSRHHARLTLSGFELLIEDMGSSNGVFIDGIQVQIPTRVRADQEVQIGSARLRIGLRESATKQLADALWDKDLGLEPLKQLLTAKKYRVLTAIGRGGMGVVMQARDVRIRRTVAMKVMKTGDQFSPENVLRFIDEAQVTGQLEHPNIVPVYELGLDDHNETFYTMKHVKGITLDAILDGLRSKDPTAVVKYPLATLTTIFQKICDGVAFAHSKGVVHRDLKPENVMIGAYGEVLVMDWGLAKNITSGRRPPLETKANTSEYAPLVDGRGFETLHGLIVGTPPYISPEQARGEIDKIDARSDIFVLGEILYAILTLRTPVQGETLAEVVEKILAGHIKPPTSFNQGSRPSGVRPVNEAHGFVDLVHCPGKRIPEGLSAVVMKALQVDPALRYPNVEEMQADITAWQGGFAPKAERAGLLKQIWLFVGRHKTEVALSTVAFVVFNVLVVGFIYQLAVEKTSAQESARRAMESAERALTSEKLAAERLVQLRGTAPTYFQDAQSLIEDQAFEEALKKIDYAIEQVPNEANYLNLRGNVLQSLFRWEEALLAFTDALERNPKHAEAKRNRDLTARLLNFPKRDERISQPALREMHTEFIKQGRVAEALAVLKELVHDRFVFETTWKAAFEHRGLKNRVETNDDDTLNVNFSQMPQPDLRKLRDMPVVRLNLDDTRLPDLAALTGSRLQQISINRTLIKKLSPLAGMPLKVLSADGSLIVDLHALSGVPLESLHISDTGVTELSGVDSKKLRELVAANCRGLKDISALKGLALQKVNLSRTGIQDISALVGCPVRELVLEGCADLLDIKVLQEFKSLETLVLPAQCKDVEFLRGHPTLRRLSYKQPPESIEEFWKKVGPAPKPGKD